MPKRLTYEEVYNAIKDNDCELLETDYINSRTKMKIRCSCDNIFMITFDNFKHGHRCTECRYKKSSDKKRISYETVKEIFENENFILLSNNYKNSKEKLEVICPNEHKIKISLGDFLRGSRCAECSGKLKKTIEEVGNDISKEGYTLLSTAYKNNNEKLLLKCPNNHEFNMSYVCFIYQSQRCPYCQNCARYTYEDVRESIENLGYSLLSNSFIDVKTKLEIKCPESHSFTMDFDHFRKGQRCPKCYAENRGGKNNWNWKGGVSPLTHYLRSKLNQWIKDSMINSGFKCVVTGKRFDDIHHLVGFNTILQEVLNVTNIPLKNEIGEYSSNDLKILEQISDKIHRKYPLGVCLTKETHEEFHKIYGYGDNTPTQFYEFYRMKTGKDFNLI